MRTLGLILALGSLAWAGDAEGKAGPKIDKATAKEAIKTFKKRYRQRELPLKQGAIFDLHDYDHPLVAKELRKLLRKREVQIAQVAALAMGGQKHDVEETGETLMKTWDRRDDDTPVLQSILSAWQELGYLDYWPKLEKTLKDERNQLVIGTMKLLGTNKDYRALPRLLEMYHVAMPKRVKWKTGEVTVDTGTAGDADQKAAEAEFNRRYGRGGSKEKAKAKRKAKAHDERNFKHHLRRCVKAITGEGFDNAIDFEDWYLENYLAVAKRIAELQGTSVEAAVAKAKAELPEFRAKVEKRRKKYEEAARKAREG